MTECKLLVARADLVAAFQPMGKFLRRTTKQEAVFQPAPGGLEIALGGITTVLRGEGSWTLRVRIPGTLFIGLARRLPQDDPITIAVEGSRCRIGPLALTCGVSAPAGPIVSLPMNATVGEVLALRQRHAATVLEQSGMNPALAEAAARRDRAITRALEALAPLGVTRADLRWTIERAVRRQVPRKVGESGQVVLFGPPEESGEEG